MSDTLDTANLSPAVAALMQATWSKRHAAGLVVVLADTSQDFALKDERQRDRFVMAMRRAGHLPVVQRTSRP